MDVRRLIKQLRANKIPYTVELSGSKLSVNYKYGNFSDQTQNFSIQELALVNRVRHYIYKNFPENNNVPELKFIDKGNFFDCATATEIDLSKAYWTAARKLNFISDEIYQLGLNNTKRAKLASLGTVAKSKYIWQFDGNISKLVKVEKSPYRYIYFQIAKEIEKIMHEIRSELDKDFLFFWVDAVFFNSKKKAQFCL